MKKLKEIIAKISEYLSKSKTATFFKNFIFVLLFYGVTINFALSQFFKGIAFSIANIIACGIISYCLKAEVPEIIRKSIR